MAKRCGPHRVQVEILIPLFVFLVLLLSSKEFSGGQDVPKEAEIEALFRGDDPGKKLEWIWRIPKLHERSPDQAGKLVRLGAGDSDEVIRQNTLLAIESIGSDGYLPIVERALLDEKESVRWFARYAAKAGASKDPLEELREGKGKGVLECKYHGMLGYYGPHSPNDEWGWRDMEEFKRLGYGYAFGNAGLLTDLWCPDRPSWKGGRARVPSSFWEAMERYEAMGIDFYFVFEPRRRSGYAEDRGEELGQPYRSTGWHSHFYEKGLDREIQKTWDKSAPPGWTLLDEFRLHVRTIMEANKQHGDLIDGWLFFSEPTQYDLFGNNYENIGMLIRAGIEEAKKISPEAYLGFHGNLGPRLDLQRELYANGATDVYAAAFRRYLNTMPEALHLSDGVTRGGGWLETFDAFYSQARKWGIVDPRDGKTKVVDMERFLNVVGEDRGPTFGPRTFLADKPFQREKHADYWARSILLALSTGFVSKLSAVYHNNPFWSWGSPSGIGVQYDVNQVRQLREQDIASEFEKGKIPPKPRDMSNRTQVMKWTFYEIFRKKGKEGLYQAMDGYLAERRPDLRKPAYFASMILNHLLGDATFISRLFLEEPDFGLRFRDDATGRMITALWRAAETDSEVALRTVDPLVRTFQRIGDEGIREEKISVKGGRFTLRIGSNPVYVAGELVDDEWMRVNLLNQCRHIEEGEKGIFEIAYQADRDMSGGLVEIEIPPGWIDPQTVSPGHEGYVTVEPGAGVKVGNLKTEGRKISVPIVEMRNGHTLRVIYGDARRESFLFDMGEDQFGPISLDHQKMQGNMVYHRSAGDGFDHEGLPRAQEEFWAQWPSAGGCGIPDNDPYTIYRDMAVSATYDGWKFAVDGKPGRPYQVKIFLNGSGKIDDGLISQKVTIGGRTFDSSRDRLLHRVVPDEGRRIVVHFTPDGDGNSMNRYFEGDRREDIHYSHRRAIPDDTRICYVYGLEIVPEHLGGGPKTGAVNGPASFNVHIRSADGKLTRLSDRMSVTPASSVDSGS